MVNGPGPGFMGGIVLPKDVQAAMGGCLDFCVVRKSNIERPGMGKVNTC